MDKLSGRRRERAECRLAIRDDEVPHLEALGDRIATLRRVAGRTQGQLSTLRRVAGLTQGQLAAVAEAASTIRRIEAGTRRTRHSTRDEPRAVLGSPSGSPLRTGRVAR